MTLAYSLFYMWTGTSYTLFFLFYSLSNDWKLKRVMPVTDQIHYLSFLLYMRIMIMARETEALGVEDRKENLGPPVLISKLFYRLRSQLSMSRFPLIFSFCYLKEWDITYFYFKSFTIFLLGMRNISDFQFSFSDFFCFNYFCHSVLWKNLFNLP